MMDKPLQERAEFHAARRKRRRSGCLAVISAPILVLLLLGGWFVIRINAQPKLARNFTAEFNEQVEQIPPEERAWPLYKQAILFGIEHPRSSALIQADEVYPGWALWPEAVAWLEAAQPELELVRQAAARPSMGKPLSLRQNDELIEAQAAADGRPYTPEPSSENPFLFEILLPELRYLREWANHLRNDAHLSMLKGDSERATEDIVAMIGLARHFSSSRTLIEQLVRFRTEAAAISTTLQILQASPDAFTDDQLARLQQALLAQGTEACSDIGLVARRVDFGFERDGFLDLVQRLYSDDGHGGGHMTLRGMTELREFASSTGGDSSMGFELLVLAAPRDELVEVYNARMDALDAAAARPAWDRRAAAQDLAALEDRLGLSNQTDREKKRYFLIALLDSSFKRVIHARDLADARADAAIAVLALHRHRLAHGTFPDAIDALVPDFLQALPADPVDGQSLQYRLTESGPILYSLGKDGDDDSGMRGKNEEDVEPGGFRAAKDGDWVLFPVIIPAEPKGDDAP